MAPVLSLKSKRVYEKSIIEAHIKEYGTDPITEDSLVLEDLIPIDVEPILPKSPANASIPGLLASLQHEFDTLVLESHALRKQVHQTRAELASALTRNDASLRVIARLSQESSEAQDALSLLDDAYPRKRKAPSNGDQAESPAGFDLAKLKTKQAQLQKERKQRNKSRKKPPYKVRLPLPGDQIFVNAYHGPRDYAWEVMIVANGVLTHLLHLNGKEWESDVVHAETLDNESRLVDNVVDAGKIYVSSSDGLYDGSKKVSGRLGNVALHPAEYIFGQRDSGSGLSEVLEVFDLNLTKIAEIPGNYISYGIHPDGDLIFSVQGGKDTIEIYSLLQQQVVKTLKAGSGDVIFSFNDNGYTVAIASSEGLCVFDLRSDEPPDWIVSESVRKIAFDDSGRYLAAFIDTQIRLFEYKRKTLEELEISPHASQTLESSVDFAWMNQDLLLAGSNEKSASLNGPTFELRAIE